MEVEEEEEVRGIIYHAVEQRRDMEVEVEEEEEEEEEVRGIIYHAVERRRDMEGEVRGIIYHAVDFLEILIGEEKLFRAGADAGVESLKVQLEILRTTINSSLYEPRKAAKNLPFEEITDVMRRVQFVFEAYLSQAGERRQKRGVFNSFFIPRSDQLAKNSQKDVEVRVRSISDRVKQMKLTYSKLEKYPQGDRSIGVGLLDVPRVFEENELVGIQSQKERLVKLLVGEPSRRLVISVAGIAGIGKTTLASIAYQSEEVQQHFKCHAWINMSQSYDLNDVLSRLVGMICPDENYPLEGEVHLFYHYLLAKRYVIVFDGVWQTDFFHFLKEFCPDNNRGSRIIITTRDNLITASCDIAQSLQPLSEDRAQVLFLKSASVWTPSPMMEELSLEIVKRGHGLPLVIWAIGDLMSTKRHTERASQRLIQLPKRHNLRFTEIESQWQVQLQNLDNNIRESPSDIEEVLRIFYHNYDCLPSHIKLCLLYFGIFPKDYLISDAKLVKLWVAEGFVKEEMGKTLEQVAETYPNDLINRNLVQVSHINYDGTERMCRVYGFLHLLISSRAKRYRIFQDFNKTTSRLLVADDVRRVSIYGDAINTLDITTEHPHICSVFLFDVNRITMRKSFMVNLFERFKLLELLDFENAPLDDLPAEVGNLSFLKYLGLRNTTVKKLPKSVGRLLNLQTLDVRNTLLRELPIHVQKLPKLRHLLASAHNNKVSLDSVHGVQIKEGIGCLENLQTLMTVEAHRSSLGVIEEFEKLRQLRWLSISKLTTDMVKTLCSFIEKMTLLESLSLYLSTDQETFNLESISSPPPLLRRLILKGRLEKLPDWILLLQRLTVLGLSFSRLSNCDPLEALQCLPNLKFLWLHRAYDGEELHFKGVSFQRLKQLVLTELQNLKRIRIEKGALPLVEEMRLGPGQNDLSFDIQHLKNLQLLECYDMSDGFVLSLQPEGGSDYWKVKHIPSVVFRYRVRGSHYVSYKLGETGLLDHVKGLVRTSSNVQLYGRQLSFFYNDDEEVARASNAEWSDQYSFFTDDIVD